MLKKDLEPKNDLQLELVIVEKKDDGWKSIYLELDRKLDKLLEKISKRDKKKAI